MWLLLVFFFLADSQDLVYEGQLYDSSGNLISSANVVLKAEILDDGVCVLYERSFNLDLSNSNGHFSINLNSGSVPAGLHAANTLGDILSNGYGNSVTCANGTIRNFDGNYVERKIRITIEEIDSTDIEDIVLPMSKVKRMPYANEAQTSNTLQGVLIDKTAPEDGQVLRYSAATSRYQPADVVANNYQAIQDADPCDAAKGGAFRYNSTTGAMEYCDGVAGAWKAFATGSGIPAGTVAYFDLASCPTGWSAYTTGRGRVIIGTGTLSSHTYSLNQTGGAATVTLTQGQIPGHVHSVNPPNTATNSAGNHSHSISGNALGTTSSGPTTNRAGGNPVHYSTGTNAGGAHTHSVNIAPFNSASTGGGNAHENRPPFVALLACKKD